MQTERRKTTTTPTSQNIADHLPLVERIVAHFIRRLPKSVQRDDLVAAGTLGLFYALRSSDHTCEEMFAAYARIRIRGSIVDELRRHDWSPRRRKDPNADAPARSATVTSIAPGAPGAPGATSAVASIPPVRPRVAVVGFDDLPAGPSAGLTDGAASPLDDVLERRAHAALHAAVESLPEREREIIRLRYFQGRPSKAIAQAMGLSEARISQLHARAIARLKELLGDFADSAADLSLAA